MRKFWLDMRSVVLWAISGVHFFFGCAFLMLMAIFVDPRKNDRPQRAFSRNVLRLAGVGFEVRRSPDFDAQRTSFFVVNHVNLFDPFVLYSAIPQFVRGLELESHFRIPIYGLLMKRFGNIPVPDVRRPSDLKRMWKMTREALDRGVSLIVFPEGKRTLDGRVGEFQDGAFRMAQQFGYPIVPVSIVGSFEFNNKHYWALRPSRIAVHIHGTIETVGMKKEDVRELRDRVRRIVAAPLDAYYAGREVAGQGS
ncbi:MAG TPA: lysophospholipid acyltransferase family protein [Candidatus Acidoferrales bacterium]|nr:lysophospholipid acyltransferase family protein [Candidatus Acidoferrales bacterium]